MSLIYRIHSVENQNCFVKKTGITLKIDTFGSQDNVLKALSLQYSKWKFANSENSHIHTVIIKHFNKYIAMYD